MARQNSSGMRRGTVADDPPRIRYNAGTEFADFLNAELSLPGAPPASDLRNAPALSSGYVRLLRLGGEKGRHPSRNTLKAILETLGWTSTEPASDGSVLAEHPDGRRIAFVRDARLDGRTEAARLQASQRITIGDDAANALHDLSADISAPLASMSLWLNSEHLGRATFEADGLVWDVTLRRHDRRIRYLKLRHEGWTTSLRVPERPLPTSKIQWEAGWTEHVGEAGWDTLWEWTAPDRLRHGLAAMPPAIHPLLTLLGAPDLHNSQPPDSAYASEAHAVLAQLTAAIPNSVSGLLARG